MKTRDAAIEDLPTIVEFYNSNVPTRASVADTEPISVADRVSWFHEHDPQRRPIRIVEDEAGRVGGWLSLSDFYDGRPAYNATAEIGIHVREDLRAPALGITTLTAGIFAHNAASVTLFEESGFQRWAYFPEAAELDGVRRDLLALGRKLDRRTQGGVT